jgi:hypothetical protein
MKKYFLSWNYMRIIRFALGLFIVIQSIQTQEWLFLFMGIGLTLLPVFNVGCCSTSACATPIYRNRNKTEDVSYEEIK